MSAGAKDSPRSHILGRLRGALGRAGDAEAQEKARIAAQSRLNLAKPNLIPNRAKLPVPRKVALFVEMATGADATVARVRSNQQVPEAVTGFLKSLNLPMEAAIAPDPSLDAIPWAQEPLLNLKEGKTAGADPVSITGIFRAIAETGTCMLISGEDTPTTLNFLPDTHIIVLWASQVESSMEEAWDALRAVQTAALGEWKMPRTVNFVTGPSRSADIEQTLQLGAHGPRRLHLILIDDMEEDRDTPRPAGR